MAEKPAKLLFHQPSHLTRHLREDPAQTLVTAISSITSGAVPAFLEHAISVNNPIHVEP